MPSREWMSEKIANDPDAEDCGAVPATEPVAWIDRSALPLPKDTRGTSHMAVVYASKGDGFGGERQPLYAQADYESRIKSALAAAHPPAVDSGAVVEGEAVAALLAGKPFVFDPATNFAHTDDGGAPEHGVRWVLENDSAVAIANEALDIAHDLAECHDWLGTGSDSKSADREQTKCIRRIKALRKKLYAHPPAAEARIAEAVAAEREACAKLIRYRVERLRGNRKRIAQVDQHVISIMESLAAAICAREALLPVNGEG